MARVAHADIIRQLDEIAAVLEEHPGGLTRDALTRAYTARYVERLAPRTLLRRLDALVAAGRATTGAADRGRAPVYRPTSQIRADALGDRNRPVSRTTAADAVAPGSNADAPPRDVTPQAEPYVPLSPEGEALRVDVRRPIMYRQPIGYDRGMLDGYEPGRTWYLPESLREQLHERGRTPDADRPAGTYARDIYERLLVDLAWASSRLEGNTYDRLDTQNLLEFGLRADGKDAEETQMILNHKRAIELLVDGAGQVGFNAPTLFALHAALSDNLLRDPNDEGRLRRRLVQITGTTYTPVGIPHVIEDAFGQLLRTAAAIPDPFEQAFFVMVHLPYLQPFADVNKRTSRLAANIPLIAGNLCPLSFVDVPVRAYVDGTLAVHEQRRVELLRDVFAWAYFRSCDQYKVVRDSTAQPDPIRLRYRDALDVVVQDCVRSGAAPGRRALRAWAAEHAVPGSDLDAFTDRALAALLNLNQGTAARAGLRPSEYEAWRARFASVAAAADVTSVASR